MIFISIAASYTLSNNQSHQTGFTAEKPKVTIINRDTESPIIQGLTEFIYKNGIQVDIDDNDEKLQDAVFYNATDYIIIIPKGFTESFNKNTKQLETLKFLQSPLGYQMELVVNRYLTAYKTYSSSQLFTEKEKISLATNDASISSKTTLLSTRNYKNAIDGMIIFNRTVPYVFILLIVLCVTSIMMSLETKEIRMRNLISPKSDVSIKLSMLSFTLSFGVATWFIVSLISILINMNQIHSIDTKSIALMMINSFSFMVVSVSLALLVGLFVKNASSQNAAANILGLGLSFLGGVFVPLELLDETFLKFSKLTPAYWHTINLSIIENTELFTLNNLTPFFQGIIIQFGFAMMFFTIFLAIGKTKQSTNSL